MSKQQQLTNHRKESGKLLQNNVKRIDEINYEIKSSNGKDVYSILSTELGWVCSCPDHMFRGVKCKHVYAVEFSLEIRKTVVEQIHKIEPININGCKYCKSDSIIKCGLRKNKQGNLQKFQCKDCNRCFTINLGFERMKHNPQGITTAMQLYFSGESLRNTAKSLELLGVEVSHQTIYNWIEKYTSLMEKYLEKITPKVSTAWRTDELYLKVKGNKKYLYALMDDETRFWIAQQVAETKYDADIRPLFQKGKETMGKRPNTLISDGAPNFHVAYNKEFYTNTKPRTRHIRHIRFQGDHNNNKMERMNGEIRDREKTMRGLKKMDTPILKGYQIYHNYIREHEALKGQTPAEKCGIKIEGKNKWKTLIENASK
ncbi:MAG: DDE-type integrase/transposase/recombinase [Candidatus Nitrosocosmicus sp.]|nr:DDE-type integrase/transposase/recombinase [Candidatus Nitrosocosmicus sp.]